MLFNQISGKQFQTTINVAGSIRTKVLLVKVNQQVSPDYYVPPKVVLGIE